MRSQRTSTPNLLEREPELEALGAAVARAAEGTGGCLLIEGPAGVGKSRLMASGRALAQDAGLSVLEARGAARERDFAFGVARQLSNSPSPPPAWRSARRCWREPPGCRAGLWAVPALRWWPRAPTPPSGRCMASTG